MRERKGDGRAGAAAMSTAREVLLGYYRKHNPELESKVEDVLTQYPGAGGWLELSGLLQKKYKEAPPVPDTLAREIREIDQHIAQSQPPAEGDARAKARAKAKARARAQVRRGSNTSVGSDGGGVASGRRGSSGSAGSEGRPSVERGASAGGKRGGGPAMRPPRPPPSPIAGDPTQTAPAPAQPKDDTADTADIAEAARVRAREKVAARQMARLAKRGRPTMKPAVAPAPEPEPEPELELAALPEGVPPQSQDLSPVAEVREHPSPLIATPPRQRIDASAESNDEFLRLEQLAAESPRREGDLQQLMASAATCANATVSTQDLCQRTDALAGEDARALIREMLSSIPAVQEWLSDYEFPAGTTFRPLASYAGRRSAHPAAFAGVQQPGYMADLSRAPRRGSAAGSSQLSLLRQQLKSVSYSTGGQDPRRLFSLYDRDNSGSLDLKEFGNAIRKGGRVTVQQMSDADVAQLFRAADADGCVCSPLTPICSSLIGLQRLLVSHPLGENGPVGHMPNERSSTLWCLSRRNGCCYCLVVQGWHC